MMENRILVLDNDPGVLEAIDLSLTYCGFRVKPLLTGENLIAMIDDFEPNLILMDYFINGKTGGDICIELKKDKQRKDIPVIMLSVHPESADRKREFGCDSFLSKPFDLNILVAEIRLAIESRLSVVK